jgi:hypothetical protein
MSCYTTLSRKNSLEEIPTAMANRIIKPNPGMFELKIQNPVWYMPFHGLSGNYIDQAAFVDISIV